MSSIKFFLAAALAICVPVAHADFAPITGAWGVKFGQVWTDKSRPLLKKSIYAFTPNKPTPGLDRYFVGIDPKANSVVAIAGEGQSRKCVWVRETILPHLEKKYGKANIVFESSVDSSSVFEAEIDDGSSANRQIVIVCAGTTAGTFYTVRYHDGDIEKKMQNRLHETESQAIEESDL